MTGTQRSKDSSDQVSRLTAASPRPPGEDTTLKQCLDQLLHEARKNEITLRRFQEFELRLMGCNSLPELLRLLIHGYREGFDCDIVALSLLDAECEIRRLLTRAGVQESEFPDLSYLSNTNQFAAIYQRAKTQAKTPFLGRYSAGKHRPLFPKLDKAPLSVGLVPLIRNNILIGSLNLGSHCGTRYSRHSATDFLQHLGAVISVCLETAIYRERLRFLGLTDALTEVNNRRFFEQRLSEEIARASRLRMPLSCLFIDVDHFKKINDVHGHQIGDDVLKCIARLIRKQLRTIDVVARYGGEEFAALLARAPAEEAKEVATRIKDSIETYAFPSASGAIKVTVSIGVTALTPARPLTQPEAIGMKLVEYADRAVYEAKRAGRNRVVVLNPDP